MNSRAKGIWAVLGAVAILAILVLLKLRSLPGAPGSAGVGTVRDQGIPVSMEVIRAEQLRDRIATVGTVLPNEEVELRSEISGKIERIYFSEGSAVGKGEVLVKITDAELQAQLLRARYRQAIAEEQAERQHQLFAKEQISQVEYDSAVNTLNISRAEVQLIQAQLDKTEIRAPFAGIIGLRQVSEGSYLSPATPIAVLQDTRRVKIEFAVPEKYAGALEVGDEIRFSVQGAPQTFAGSIYALETRIDQATRTLRLRALSPNPEGALIPGAFAEIEIALPEKEGLTIPASALIPELKGHRVFLCVAGKAVSQPVQIGARSAERIAIAKGVRAGDTLITSAILQLRPGMAVRPALAN